MAELNFPTKVIHTPFIKKDPHGSLNMPVYDNVAFESGSAEEIHSIFEGEKQGHIYSRISNPTVEYLEEKMKHATGALSTTALSSGMAAITNLMVTISQTGVNIVTTRHIFGNTYSLFEKTLKPFGIEFRYADLTDPESVEKVIDENTIALFVETITNPQLEVADLSRLSELTQKHNILLVADTTLTPPNMFRANEFGIDVEVLSSTKIISGGATSVGGIIVDYGTYNWRHNSKLKDEYAYYGPFAFLAKLRKEVYRNMGSCLSPHNAYLQISGLDTLSLRSRQSNANCLRIAQFLNEQERVRHVNYPGLENSPFYEVSKKQFGDNPGSLLTFTMNSKEECFNFINKLKVLRRATNLQDNKTLVLHPASTIFNEYDEETRKELGVPDNMIRISVGIEDAEDLIEDIKQALDQ